MIQMRYFKKNLMFLHIIQWFLQLFGPASSQDKTVKTQMKAAKLHAARLAVNRESLPTPTTMTLVKKLTSVLATIEKLPIYLYIWSDAAALELSKGSNKWFRFILDNKLALIYSPGKTERGSDSNENRGVLKNTTPYAKVLENSIQKIIQNPRWRYEVDFNIPEGDLCNFPRTPIKFLKHPYFIRVLPRY